MDRILVIGYGNTLRRDDGAGPEVARRIEALALPGVDTLEAHQLLPEHAELLSRVDRAIFIDASVGDCPEEIRMEPVAPDPDAGFDAHASDPGGMLALAQILFERAPKAWIIPLPAADLDIGEGLSATAEDAVEQAVKLITGFCKQQ